MLAIFVAGIWVILAAGSKLELPVERIESARGIVRRDLNPDSNQQAFSTGR